MNAAMEELVDEVAEFTNRVAGRLPDVLDHRRRPARLRLRVRPTARQASAAAEGRAAQYLALAAHRLAARDATSPAPGGPLRLTPRAA